MNPPPLKWVLIIFAATVAALTALWLSTEDWSDKQSHPGMVHDGSTTPTAGWVGDGMVTSPPKATATPAGPAVKVEPTRIREGFTVTEYGWCEGITDYSKMKSVLEVSFTTKGVFGFALGSPNGPAPKAFSMPISYLGDVGVVGFNDPDLNRLTIALSTSPEENNGWKVLGSMDIFGPWSVDWCGWSGVFHLSYPPDNFVEGRLHVDLYDPTEAPLPH